MTARRLFSYWPKWAFSVTVFAAILWLTLAPEPLPDEGLVFFPGIDKIVHACLFGGMAFALLFDLALARYKRHKAAPWRFSWKQLLVVVLTDCLFGAAIELAQSAMGMGRAAEIADFLADGAGALLAVLISSYILRCIFRTR